MFQTKGIFNFLFSTFIVIRLKIRILSLKKFMLKRKTLFQTNGEFNESLNNHAFMKNNTSHTHIVFNILFNWFTVDKTRNIFDNSSISGNELNFRSELNWKGLCLKQFSLVCYIIEGLFLFRFISMISNKCHLQILFSQEFQREYTYIKR